MPTAWGGAPARGFHGTCARHAADRGQAGRCGAARCAGDRHGPANGAVAGDPGVGGMITLPAGTRILLASKPVDFRKGAHGLAALAAEGLGENPFSGVMVVFRSKRAERIKILLWDGSGLCLIWKQLEGSTF